MSTFAICFVVKSILLLVAANSDTFKVPVIVFALLEQIPTAVLLFYLRPPVVDALSFTTVTKGSSRGSTATKKTSTSATSTQGSKT